MVRQFNTNDEVYSMIRDILRYCLIGTIAMVALRPTGGAANETEGIWSQWLLKQVTSHPDVVAAKEKMNATFSFAEGQDQPLYNPELESEVEREGDVDNYRIGINQKIDWWDKKGVKKIKADSIRKSARSNYEYILQLKVAEATRALIEWRTASRQAELAKLQEKQLSTLLDIINKRQKAGDLGQVDAELAFLGLSQRLKATADALASLTQAEFRLFELLPNWSDKWADIPPALWQFSPTIQLDQSVNSHPAVITARADWEVSKKNAELVQLEVKAEPTFGINAGKTGDDSLIGLSFSVPLNVRNNFSAEVRAAYLEASSIESNYLAIRRKQEFEIKAVKSSLNEYSKRYRQWVELIRDRTTQSGDLLYKQWRSGDLSSTDYILALQQRADGLSAGIELETQYQLTHIDWLLKTGQLIEAFQKL